MSPIPKTDPEIWNRYALLTCEEMRRAEQLSVDRGPHSFFDLMHVAGGAVAKAAMNHFPKGRAVVLCGTGNNGGDGYVAAQALREAGRDVVVAALGPASTSDSQKAASLWQGETHGMNASCLDDADFVIDALFGTGLTRALEGLPAQMVEEVTRRKIPVVAADMPSGVNGDTGAIMGCAFQAEMTVTFFRKKRGHVLLPARMNCGNVIVVDTGMHADVLDQINPTVAENSLELWAAVQPKCEVQNHKYHRGHLLIFGGALMTGAARLAARAAQRMGAGLVTLAAPKTAWEIYAKALESVMVRPFETVEEGASFVQDPKISSLLLGPGLGLEEANQSLILEALRSKKKCVLDADALTIFAKKPQILIDSAHKNVVFTPHLGEFSRIFGSFCAESGDKIAQNGQISARIGAILLQKGADTVVSSPDGYAVVNANAPPWLATAGAGDVLAGMIAGLMTGGMPPFEAACAGAWFHGEAAALFGEGLIAEDLIETLPRVLKKTKK
ncbi:MAG: NAD(P)H-hydrate dehydratase [Bdellovibrionales bacterium]